MSKQELELPEGLEYKKMMMEFFANHREFTL